MTAPTTSQSPSPEPQTDTMGQIITRMVAQWASTPGADMTRVFRISDIHAWGVQQREAGQQEAAEFASGQTIATMRRAVRETLDKAAHWAEEWGAARVPDGGGNALRNFATELRKLNVGGEAIPAVDESAVDWKRLGYRSEVEFLNMKLNSAHASIRAHQTVISERDGEIARLKDRANAEQAVVNSVPLEAAQDGDDPRTLAWINLLNAVKLYAAQDADLGIMVGLPIENMHLALGTKKSIALMCDGRSGLQIYQEQEASAAGITAEVVDAALGAFNEFPCPVGNSIGRSSNSDQMRAAISAAFAATSKAGA